MKRIYSLLLAVMLMGFYSCDDFLEKNPHASAEASEAITTISNADVALNGVYSAFKGSSYYGKSFVVTADIMSDEAFSVIGYSNSYGEMYKWSFTPGTGSSYGSWASMYTAIVRASNIINAIDGIEGADEDKNRIKGDALMARALAHFDLVKTFAKTYNASTASTDLGVPVVTEYEVGEPARNTVAEVYAQVIEDATAAKALITNDSPEDVRFSKYAVDALLARVYLYMNNWEKAVEYSSNVINSGQFELLTGDAFKNMWINDEGAEIIWKIALTLADASGKTPGSSYYNDAQGAPRPDYVPAEWLLNMYDTKNDVRYDSYYQTIATGYNGWTTTLVHKYPTNPNFNGQNQNGAQMPKVFRLAEMYLIRAEAYAEMGDKDAEALADLNTLRTARIEGYSDVYLTGSDLKDAIWNERSMEMAFEGHRFFDLKRKGLGFTRVPQENTVPGPNALSISSDNYRWSWPIPQAELRGNTNMVQNPGY